MSIFKEHKTHADRSASDRRRHRQKIDEAIKDGITDIVADESIIGQNGKKKIKIPVRGIKQYRFIFGSNQKEEVGSTAGNDVTRGQKIRKPNQPQSSQPGNKPTQESGEEFYEVEITLDELASYLFDSLELPELERKQLKKLLDQKPKRHGYRNKGIRPRLDKKQTVKKMLTRRNIAKRVQEVEEEDFPFRESDLRYKHVQRQRHHHSNAVLFFVMDISGSMTQEKKYLSRSFFFLLYHFIRSKYEQTEIVFIAHDIEAYEVTEDQFFSRGSSGGTMVSSALTMVEDIVAKRFHPNSWNIYMFQCSDGDNWPGDNSRVLGALGRLQTLCQFIGYCEVEPGEERLKWIDKDSGIFTLYSSSGITGLKTVKITDRYEIWPAFKKFFGGNKNV